MKSENDLYGFIDSSDEDNNKFVVFNENSYVLESDSSIRKELFNKVVFNIKDIRMIVGKYLHEGNNCSSNAIQMVGCMCKFFIADLCIKARKIAGEGEPLTPEFIFMAFDELHESTRFPKMG